MAWALNGRPDPGDLGRENRERNEAARLIQGLHEEFPDNPVYQFDSVVFGPGPISAEWESHQRRCIAIIERLIANLPPELTLEAVLASDRRYRMAVEPADIDQRSPQDNVRQVLVCVLARQYWALGQSYSSIGKQDEAEAMYQKGIHLIEGADRK